MSSVKVLKHSVGKGDVEDYGYEGYFILVCCALYF